MREVGDRAAILKLRLTTVSELSRPRVDEPRPMGTTEDGHEVRFVKRGGNEGRGGFTSRKGAKGEGPGAPYTGSPREGMGGRGRKA